MAGTALSARAATAHAALGHCLWRGSFRVATAACRTAPGPLRRSAPPSLSQKGLLTAAHALTSAGDPRRTQLLRTPAPQSASASPPRGAAQQPRASMSGATPGFRSVPAGEASQIMEKGGYTYLDVRTPEEFAAGHVPGSINIPVMLSGNFGMSLVPDFVEQVAEACPPDTPLIVGCKSGMRSKRAAAMLLQEGYSSITDVDDGFMGWVSLGLPVTK